jgi:hypothetical protein
MAKNLFFSSNALYLPDGNPVLLGQILFGSLFRSVFCSSHFVPYIGLLLDFSIRASRPSRLSNMIALYSNSFSRNKVLATFESGSIPFSIKTFLA